MASRSRTVDVVDQPLRVELVDEVIPIVQHTDTPNPRPPVRGVLSSLDSLGLNSLDLNNPAHYDHPYTDPALFEALRGM